MKSHLYAPLWKVYLNGIYQPAMNVITVSRSIGGKTVQAATFMEEYESVLTNQRSASIHQDTQARTIYEDGSPKVMISRTLRDGSESFVHHGRIVASKLDMTPQGEYTTYTSRFDAFMFSDVGLPLYNTHWADHETVFLAEGATEANWTWDKTVHQDIVLNPIIDGIPRKNCVMHEEPVDPDDPGSDPVNVPMPFDIDGVPTDWMVESNIPSGEGDPEVKWWTLTEAVFYLLRFYNKDQPWVLNPTRAAIQAKLGQDESLIRNFHIPRTQYIPQVLDRLLVPLGYSWMYIYGNLVTDKPVPYFWLRSQPENVADIPMQRFDQEVNVDQDDADHSQANSYSLKYDAYARSCEQVIVHGGLKEVEVTVDLVPAWDPALDDTEPRTLVEGSTEMEADPRLRRVFRDWVLNEGGDYIWWASDANRVNGAYYPGMLNAYDLSFEIGPDTTSLFVRRKFLKTLTVDESETKGSPAGMFSGVRVSLWDPFKLAWTNPQDCKNMPVQLLKDECGIRLGNSGAPPTWISGRFHPTEADPNDSVIVRVTGTIQCDERVGAETEWDPEAPAGVNPKTLSHGKKLFVDIGSKYKKRAIGIGSHYEGQPGFNARTVDATPDLEDLAEHTHATWNAATVSGSITLIGTDVAGLYLGWEIRSFAQRQFNIAATHSDIFEQINPAVVAVTYDVLDNKTTLSLSVLRRDLRTI